MEPRAHTTLELLEDTMASHLQILPNSSYLLNTKSIRSISFFFFIAGSPHSSTETWQFTSVLWSAKIIQCKIASLKLEFSCLPWCVFALVSVVQEVENHHPLLLTVGCVNEILIFVILGKGWTTEHLIAIQEALNKPKYRQSCTHKRNFTKMLKTSFIAFLFQGYFPTCL